MIQGRWGRDERRPSTPTRLLIRRCVRGRRATCTSRANRRCSVVEGGRPGPMAILGGAPARSRAWGGSVFLCRIGCFLGAAPLRAGAGGPAESSTGRSGLLLSPTPGRGPSGSPGKRRSGPGAGPRPRGAGRVGPGPHRQRRPGARPMVRTPIKVVERASVAVRRW